MRIVKPAMQALLVLVLLLSEASVFFTPYKVDAAPIVEGNTVRISLNDAYIEASPATLTASGWVEVTFWTRYYDGAVDVVYGFNGLDNVKAINPEVWESYEHTKYRQVPAVKTAEFKPTKIISTNTTALRPVKADTDLSLNSKYAEIVYEQTNPMTKAVTQPTIKLAYDTYDAKIGAYLYKYNGTNTETYYETYTDWNRKSQPVTNTLSHAGATKWDVAQYKSVVKNEVQKTRVWIDIPFGGTNTVSGKYNIGIKPSSLTLQQAKDQGKLWLLDPWYSASWSYRKAITVTDASADYQTKILVGKTSGATGEEVDCNGHCLDTFADLRFTAADGTTLLDYWIESVAASGTSYLATVWVQNNATPDTTLYMYYGNAGAVTTSSIKDTFVLGDDFEWGADEDNIDSAAPNITWSKTVAGTSTAKLDTGQAYTGLKSLRLYMDGVNTAVAYFTKAAGTDYAIRMMWRKDDTCTPVFGHGDGAKDMYWYATAAESISYYDGAAHATGSSMTINIWQTFELSDINHATPKYDIWFNDDPADTSGLTKIQNDASMWGSAVYNGQISLDNQTSGYVWVDNVIVRKWAATEPTFAFGSEAVPSCALTGTVTTAVESDIVAGGETIVLTLTNSTWVASGATFNAIRDDIIAGMDSAQSEAGGWDAKYKAEAATYVADVVRTNDTVVTVTMSALATYAITADETITVTVPTAALVTTAALVASPTFVITHEDPACMDVTTQAASSVEATTATGNGNLVDDTGKTVTARGIAYCLASHGTPDIADSTSVAAGTGEGAFTAAISGLTEGTAYHFIAYATESTTPATCYGAVVDVLTKPAAPTGVSATDGTDTAKVVITWTKSTGATDYHVWRDAVDLGAAGDVATADDAGADAPIITGGTVTATDGTSSTEVTLSLAGESVANGTTHTYKVVASNATGNSADSATNTGYIGHGAITYQWQVSAADSDAAYGNIGGGTTDPYSYTSAPAPVITAGAATASDGTSATHSTLTATTPPSAANGEGRYYKCVVSATGATNVTTAFNTGYRGTTTLTFAWQVSAADADAAFGALAGATTNPYNDATAVVDPDGRWYYCIVSMVGATPADTTHNRGYRAAFAAPTVVTGICSGSGTTWAGLNGMVTDQGDAAVSQYGFEYGLTTAYGTDSLTSANTANNVNYFKNLTTLSPSTIYHYRAKAFNTAWGYGADGIFATKGSPAINVNFNAGSDNCTAIWGVNVGAQTLTTSATTEYTVTSVRLEMLRVGLPGTVTVSIRRATAGAGNAPTGVDLTSGTINGNTLATSAAWYDITMATQTTLELNSTYSIVVSAANGDVSNYVCWRKVNAGGFANGNADTSVNSGVTWTAQTWDNMFELWGNQALEIQDAKVFQSYKATGDWLVTVRYVNTYAPYYDTYDVKKYFTLQLVDAAGTVKASTVMPAWGNRVGSIYLSATTVSPLTYGGDYRVRIQGTFTGTPYTEYALVGSDWLGSDLTNLDSWVLTSSTAIGTYYATTMTTYIAERGEVLNSTGAGVFNNGIAGLAQVRPAIFQTYTIPSTYAPGTITQSGRTSIPAWQTNVGPDATIMLTRVGNIVGIGGDIIAIIAFLIMMFILMALAFPAGNTTAAMVLSLPMLGAAIWFGMDLLYIGMLALVAAFLFIKNFWLDKGN